MEKKSRSLAHVATIVAVATLLSKVAGLVRQQAIAAEFGVGAAVDAYSYAYVIPGFLFVLLGGSMVRSTVRSSVWFSSNRPKKPRPSWKPLPPLWVPYYWC